MAINKLRKFRTIDEVQTFLNGGIQGSKLASAQGGGTLANLGPGVNSLVGTTLTFTLPASATVTFAKCDNVGGSAHTPGTNPDPYTLLFKDIKAQIESAVAGTLVTMFDGALVIQEAAPSGGVSIAAGSAGGFPTVVGTVDVNTLAYGPGGTVDGLTLSVKHTGGGALLTTFAAPVNRADLLAQINANTVAGGITASINGSGYLVLTANDQGASKNIQVLVASTGLVQLGLVVGTTTGAATNTANPLLGFDANNVTTGKYYKPVAAAGTPPVAPYWVWAETGNDNMYSLFLYE